MKSTLERSKELPLFGVFYAALILVLLTGVLPGCVTNPKVIKLQDTLRAYDKTIRWGSFQNAAAFQTEEVRQDGLDLSHLKSIRITGYTQLQQKMSQDQNEYTQVVEIRYYNEDYATENTIIDQQQWVYDSNSGSWQLSSKLPALFVKK
jgi:hypothetical protein